MLPNPCLVVIVRLPFVPDLVPDRLIPAIARLYEINTLRGVLVQFNTNFYLVTAPG